MSIDRRMNVFALLHHEGRQAPEFMESKARSACTACDSTSPSGRATDKPPQHLVAGPPNR